MEIFSLYSSSHHLLTDSTPSSLCLGDPQGPTWGVSHCGCLQADHTAHLLDCDMEQTQGGQEEKLGLSYLLVKPSCMGRAQIVIRAARESYRLTVPRETAPRQNREEKAPRIPEASAAPSSSQHCLSCTLSRLLLPGCNSACSWCQEGWSPQSSPCRIEVNGLLCQLHMPPRVLTAGGGRASDAGSVLPPEVEQAFSVLSSSSSSQCGPLHFVTQGAEGPRLGLIATKVG